MAETIFDLSPEEFEGYLKEKGYDKEREAFLRDEYSRNRTLSGQTRAALGSAAETEEGRERASVLPMTKPEGMSGLEAIRSGEAEWAVPGIITGTAEEAARSVETGERMRMGMEVPQEDIESAATFGAEAALVGGLSAAGRSAFIPDPDRVNMFLGDMADSRVTADLPQSKGRDEKTRYELSDAEADGVAVRPYNISFVKNGKSSSFNIVEELEKGNLTTMGDVLDHQMLYSAYPQIEDIPIFVDEGLDKNVRGYFNPNQNAIGINKNLLENPEDFKNTLVHEIQHWIQEKEGFTTGTNFLDPDLKYPAARIKEREDARSKKEFEELQKLYRQNYADYLKSEDHIKNIRDTIQFIGDLHEAKGGSFEDILKLAETGKPPYKQLGSDFSFAVRRLLEIEKELLDFQKNNVTEQVKKFGSLIDTPVSQANRSLASVLGILAEKIKTPEETKIFTDFVGIEPNKFKVLSYEDRDKLLASQGIYKPEPRRKPSQTKPKEMSVSDSIFEAYREKAGEVEARNTGTRSEMSQEKRGQISPEDTEDVPREDQWRFAYAEGGAVENQMDKLLEEGGMADDGMDRDPVSGNEIPPGSTAKEVRDDVDVKLSEGEYVVPADVVQYYGVKFFEDLRSKAKNDLEEMDEDGRIGGEPVTDVDELTPEEVQMLQDALGSDIPRGMQEGGVVQPTFQGYGGTSPMVPGSGFTPYGGGVGGTEIRSYINPDTGQTRSFMFINGQPVGTIPEGFVPNTQENREKAQQASQETQKVTTTGTRGDGPSFDTATRSAGGTGTQRGRDVASSPAEISAEVANLDKGTSLTGLAGGVAGGVLGSALNVGPILGARIGSNLASSYAETNSIATALEAEQKANILGYKDIAKDARTKAEKLAEEFEVEITDDDINNALKNARDSLSSETFALASDLSNINEAIQQAEENPYGSTIAETDRFEVSQQALEDPESFLAPGADGRSDVAESFAENVAAGTAGTISPSEVGLSDGGGDSGSSSSSGSTGGFADDPAGKDGPTGGAGTGGGGSGGGDCVVATHAVSTGAFNDEDKQRAVDWCRKNLHGNWFGETFRKGYRRVGNKYIDKGTVTKYYTEFEDYVNFVTGRKKTLRGLVSFLYRTSQFFVLGLFTKEK